MMNILITGASKGLGKEIAKELKKRNTIYGTYNKTKISDNSVVDYKFKVDFTKENELEKFISKISNESIEILINNFHPGYELLHSSKISKEDLKSSFEDYLLPTIKITNQVIKSFKKKGKGIIINILSEYTLTNAPKGLAKYSAEKKYLETFNYYWSEENKQSNIFSIAVSPSIMKTEFHNSIDFRFREIIFKNTVYTDYKKVIALILKIIKSPEHYSGKNILVK